MAAVELLDVIESIKAEDVSMQRVFGGEGTGARGIHRKYDVRTYREGLLYATGIVGGVLKGKYHPYKLQEAMSTSDFPLFFGDIIDRQILAGYREAPHTWRNYAKQGTVRDFRNVSRFTMDGGEGQLSPVAELTEYPAVALTEGRYQFRVTKYGKRIPFSWEMRINDDLDTLTSIPDRFGKGARRTEEKFATTLFVDANGPHVGFYNTANKNRIHTENGAATNNPPLSLNGLKDALLVLANLTDADGEPIAMDMVQLVVPPQLEVTALELLNALQVEIGLVGQGLNAAATREDRLIVKNFFNAKFSLNVNYYIPLVASTANGRTSWFLFATASEGRPAIEVAFLTGHAEPEIFIKEPNARRVGGGAMSPLDGNFETDAIEYKIRHVIGGGRIDPHATVASNGSSS